MNTTLQHRSPKTSTQSGAALIIGLVLLITLTILGVGVLTTTSLEQRMAGNMSDINIAFNAAETAGRELTSASVDVLGPMENVCTKLVLSKCMASNLEENWWDVASATDWAAAGVNIPGLNITPPVNSQPLVVMELERHATHTQVRGVNYQTPGIDFIRLTTRATGISANTEVIVQQTIVKQ